MRESLTLLSPHTPNGSNTPLSPRVGALGVRGHRAVRTVSAVSGVSDVTDPGARWQIVVALLVNPERESRRLAALLDRLPTDRRVHECLDDCLRRRGAGRRSA